MLWPIVLICSALLAAAIVNPETVASISWYSYLASWSATWVLAVTIALHDSKFRRVRGILFVSVAVLIAVFIVAAAVTTSH